MKRIVLFSLSAGILLLALGGWNFIPERTLPLPAGIAPSLIPLAGLILLSFYLWSCPGFKRLPFFLCWMTGGVFMLLSLGAFPQLPESWLRYPGRWYMAALALLALSRVVSLQATLSLKRFLILFFCILPVFVFILIRLESTALDGQPDLSWEDSMALILSAVPEQFRDDEEIQDYLEDILLDEDLESEDRQVLIAALQEKIGQLELQMGQFEAMKEENLAYRDEIESLKNKVGPISLCPGADTPENRVSSYKEAVRPAKPCVRDFAVSLASEFPGPYSSGGVLGQPGPEGLAQLITIHRYVSNQWKYVNDPLFVDNDYYSPADRTLALGIAGDCDDFAILMASLIEAVGGRTRIVHGSCSSGYHAWAEVFIGSKSNWELTMTKLQDFYPGMFIRRVYMDSSGHYWLSLDWQIGSYSCGNDPELRYESSFLLKIGELK
ncbi:MULTISPECIES: transglutaminase-like domain-containing protein [unclassified Oceanispirochaeta]|uniref:transglutaminase-like domain-containing protein n=1 Tax=unclassified Oceanispirochaeta TaxID=2635722 RepID=UPI000E093864|nr:MULTISPECIES: transglutaminase-like domain-containing protein [unclassified Oceanispirochaeta]MBF9018475.1 transglutaminase domain-containing protein [Oceanispirochaeta sp. M2]NPD74881.1 transglutaminase domain-containing protein [Oceanispirochaeta sp. M1]RDG29268.1 transglutaminase domain-containing protein [Oceanispirochaeta sp. M1]